jgi:hypothetical protein
MHHWGCGSSLLENLHADYTIQVVIKVAQTPAHNFFNGGWVAFGVLSEVKPKLVGTDSLVFRLFAQPTMASTVGFAV